MTREEEKEKAARRYATHDVDTDETDFYGNYVKKEDFVLPEYNAFIEGSKWSDANPKSPWISVKDDLPCNHEELINPKDITETIPVLANIGSVIGITKMVKNSYTGEWIWVTQVTVHHWMPIPELPKE